MEVVVRGAILWFFLQVVIRGIGRKELAQLSAFEFVLLVVMGDLIQQGVTQQDTSVTAAMLAVATLAVLTVAASYLSFRWRRLSPLIEGVPVVLVEDGVVMRRVLELERLTMEELRDAARAQGIEDLREVRLGVLEADGGFSFVRADRSQGSPPETTKPSDRPA